MNHLNYFFPFTKNDPKHSENDLTRAFLVLLRFIPLAQHAFIDLLRTKMFAMRCEKIPPSLSDSEMSISTVESQVRSINREEGRLISVLLTDEEAEFNHQVKRSKREAVYDGVVYYDPGFIFIIENKPNIGNAWAGQLDPGNELEERIEIEPRFISLTWKEIIDSMNGIEERKQFGPTEQLLWEDFRQFINQDKRYSFLNPYNKLSRCNDSTLLLNNRCVSIMEKMKPGKVKKQRGWSYCIEVDNKAIWMIAINADGLSEDKWQIKLELFPGDTLNQAREFYSKVNQKNFLELAREKQWDIQPNLHFAHMQKHLHWAKSPIPLKKYLNYWMEHPDEIRQVKRNDKDYKDIIAHLLKIQMITPADVPHIHENFTNTNRSFMNVIPGIRMYYIWSKEEALRLDDEGKFEDEARKKIKQAFGCWNEKFD